MKKLNWYKHGELRATAELDDCFYEVAYHYGRKTFFVEVQRMGRKIFFEYAPTLEEAKLLAHFHAFPFENEIKDL